MMPDGCSLVARTSPRFNAKSARTSGALSLLTCMLLRLHHKAVAHSGSLQRGQCQYHMQEYGLRCLQHFRDLA